MNALMLPVLLNVKIAGVPGNLKILNVLLPVAVFIRVLSVVLPMFLAWMTKAGLLAAWNVLAVVIVALMMISILFLKLCSALN
jgi:hypothetical protein